MRTLPPLNALRAFEAAARHLSLTRAADELRVTHGAVSRAVSGLEAWLGCPLFQRFNRRIELTDEGRRYLGDIGAALGIYGGSLYHHVRSKEDLFLAVHGQALAEAAEDIRRAADAVADPWDRLEAASVRLLEIQLDPRSITTPMMNDFASAPTSLKAALTRQRDGFEALFKQLAADLPLDGAIDRDIFRITLLSLLNNAVVWYRPGRLSPAEIGRRIIAIYRHPA
jgi:AcrR family transcriptional regulator